MSRTGWTDTLLRTTLLVVAASALSSCATHGDTADSAAAAQNLPSPAVQAQYASLVDRLRGGDPLALAELAQFSDANPQLAGPLLNLGLVQAREGDEVGAGALFERASTVCSRCGPVWNALGVLARQQGRFADAEQAYVRAIEMEPGYAPAYYNLAVLYEIYIPRPELALENYERYLQLGGTSGEGEDVEKWAADLRRRAGATPKTASTGGPS